MTEAHWEDMGLYWAQRGSGDPGPVPTEKRIVYTEIRPGFRIASAVYDDDVRRDVNQEEIAARMRARQ